MNTKYFLIILTAVIALMGCEETALVEIEAVDHDYITIQAELIGGEEFNGVTITKPLPFNQTYDIERAKLTNLIAYIKIDFAQVIPLHHTVEGVYKPLYELIIEPGATYELFARIGDRKIYAITNVPEVPNVNQVTTQTDFSFTAKVISKPGVVYGATWVILIDDTIVKADNFFEINEHNDNYFVDVNTQILPENLRPYAFGNMKYVQVFAFDKPFLDYFNTIENNQPVEDYFTQGGGPVAWNVVGDRTIGMFIGMTPSELIRPE